MCRCRVTNHTKLLVDTLVCLAIPFRWIHLLRTNWYHFHREWYFIYRLRIHWCNTMMLVLRHSNLMRHQSKCRQAPDHRLCHLNLRFNIVFRLQCSAVALNQGFEGLAASHLDIFVSRHLPSIRIDLWNLLIYGFRYFCWVFRLHPHKTPLRANFRALNQGFEGKAAFHFNIYVSG